jgi:hypothetical protein
MNGNVNPKYASIPDGSAASVYQTNPASNSKQAFPVNAGQMEKIAASKHKSGVGVKVIPGQSKNVKIPSSPVSTRLSVEFLNEEERGMFASVISSVSPPRGGAVLAIANYLVARKLCATFLGGLILGSELVVTQSDAVCETLATLLNDGWEEGLGLAIEAARSL